MAAFDYLRLGGRCFGARGGGLPSVGSCSSQPDTKDADFRKKGVLLLAEHPETLGSWVSY
jgi:hypothetical protein